MALWMPSPHTGMLLLTANLLCTRDLFRCEGGLLLPLWGGRERCKSVRLVRVRCSLGNELFEGGERLLSVQLFRQVCNPRGPVDTGTLKEAR